MRYRLEFRPYRRSFRQPLRTHHGIWRVREGIILRLVSGAGEYAYGEIAPIDWMGSETIEQALDCCRQLSEVTAAAIAAVPDHLPACQFGLQSAWESMQPSSPCAAARRLPNSYLLPTGGAALTAWRSPYNSGFTTFKWKIGAATFAEEFAVFQQLMPAFPVGVKLRLDANGGLTWDTACRWLEACENTSVEFLEQPLPVQQFETMLKLSHQFAAPIALDESVTTIAQLQACYQQGWRGIFVVKAAIAGSPLRLRAFCRQSGADVVWSSALETAIARRFIADRLIAVLPQPTRAVGFGVDHWFHDTLNQPDFDRLWQTL